LYVLRKKKNFSSYLINFGGPFPLISFPSMHLLLFLCFMQSRECLLEIHEKVSRILTMCYSCFHRYCFCVFFLLALLLIWPHHSYLFFTYTNVHMRDFYYCNIFFSCKCPDVFDLSGVLSSELSHFLIFLNIMRQSAVVLRLPWFFCGSFT